MLTLLLHVAQLRPVRDSRRNAAVASAIQASQRREAHAAVRHIERRWKASVKSETAGPGGAVSSVAGCAGLGRVAHPESFRSECSRAPGGVRHAKCPQPPMRLYPGSCAGTHVSPEISFPLEQAGRRVPFLFGGMPRALRASGASRGRSVSQRRNAYGTAGQKRFRSR